MSLLKRHLFRSRTRWIVVAAVFAGAITALVSSNVLDGLTMGMVVFTCSGLNLDNVVFMAPFIGKLPHWGKILFLTVGLGITVAGVEIILPLAIVSAINHIGFAETFHVAAFHPKTYVVLQENSAQYIDAGSFTFLALLALTTIMSPRTVKWWAWAENRLALWGQNTLMAFAIVGVFVVGIGWLAPTKNRTVLLLVMLTVFVAFFIFKIAEQAIENKSKREGDAAQRSKSAALMLLAFITVLESVLNIDALAGAYAITDKFKVVVIGLIVSALVMRAMMFDASKINIEGEFKYIIIGASWAIMWLSVMLGLVVCGVPVPDMLIGVGGTVIILGSGVHSRRDKRAESQKTERVPAQA